jgi:hypothetical protein
MYPPLSFDTEQEAEDFGLNFTADYIVVIELNRQAYEKIKTEKHLAIVPARPIV